MATYRRPKGVYSRVGPDFFIQNAATAGGAYTSSMAHNAQVSLYNNDSASRYLHVYGIWVGNDAEFVYTFTGLRGTNGTQLGLAEAVIIGNPRPPGVIYGSDAPNLSNNNDPQDGGRFFSNNVSGTVDAYQTPGPIVVIPPGYSLAVTTYEEIQPAALAIIVASFYYIFMTDPG